jgi:hypothetical protein
VIVTFNVTDFPEHILNPFGMAAVTPDTFLVQLLNTGFVVTAAAEHRASLRRPSMSVMEYLDALRRNSLPGTAAALAADHTGHI